MSDIAMDRIVDRLRANLEAAGIALGKGDLEAMATGGQLRPVEAFGRAAAAFASEGLPGYLAAAREFRDGDGTEEESPAPAPASGTTDASAEPPPEAAASPRGPLDLLLHEAAALIRKGELSPLDLARASLARIGERKTLLNAFQLVLAEGAIEAARRAEAEIIAGSYRGPLHGIPVAVKDLLDLAGTPTTSGSRILAGTAVARDSTAVTRLAAAGAVIVGKTRMSEFAYSPGSNNDHYGATRNPRSLKSDSGGSSSGSAAATADRMVFAALGTDTGGSIRIPAAFCGLVGFKPTFGLSSLHGATSLSWSLDHLGPLARCVLDAALLLDAVSGPDPLDPRTLAAPARGPASAAARRGVEGLRGLRVGLLRDDGSGRPLANEAGLAAWKAGLAALEAAGAGLVEVELPELQGLRSLNSAILAIEAAAFHLPFLRTRLSDYGDFMRLRILAGWAYDACDFVRAQQGLLELRRRCEAVFARIDLLSLPTMPGEAPALGTPARINLTSPFNALGWPALSLPVGATVAGLPLAMQLVGRPWDEAGVLRAARAAELRLHFS